MAKPNKKRAAEVLEEALALMNDSGAHWIKGSYKEDTDHGDAYCSVGAVRQVIYGGPFPTLSSLTKRRMEQLVLESLRDAYRPSSNEPHSIIITWNDRKSTNWENVVKRFTLARKKLLES